MNAGDHFIRYFNRTLDEEITTDLSISRGFLIDFIQNIPAIERELFRYIQDKKFDLFRSRLKDLKFLGLYNEELNKYWFAMDALSEILHKLLNPMTLTHARSIYQDYVLKYRSLQNPKGENWIENQCRNLLETLHGVLTEEQLGDVMDQNLIKLSGLLDIYTQHLSDFTRQIKPSVR